MQENFIRRVPRFASLSQPLLAIIYAACEQRRYGAGDMILVQGTIPAGLYILLQGQAVWLQTGMDGRVIQLGTMSVGQHIHDEALVDDKALDTASLQAVTTTTMLVLSRKTLMSLVTKYPELQAALGIKPKPMSIPAPKASPAKIKATKTEAELVDVGIFAPFNSVLSSPSASTIFRNHWTSWLSRVFFPMLFVLVGLLLMISLVLGNPLGEFAAHAWAASGIFLLLSFLWLFSADWHWHNDFVLLNASHLTLVERHLFGRGNTLEAIPLQNIQTVKLIKPNLLQQILAFGDVELAFFGKDEGIYLQDMSVPLIFKSEIERRQGELARQGVTEIEKKQAEIMRQLQRNFDNVTPTMPAPLPYDYSAEAPKPSPFGQPRPKTGEILPPEGNLPANPLMPNKPTNPRPPKFPQKRQS